MRCSHLSFALFLGGAFAIPVAEPQDLDLDAYDAVPTAPIVGAPIGNSVTSSVAYDPSAVAAAATTIASAAATTTAASAATSSPASSRLTKRGSCLPDTPGNYITIAPPVAADDSPSSFLNYAPFTSDALNAVAPPGYVLAPGYQNLDAAAQSSTYLTYISSDLTSYDPDLCAARCDSILGCSSFNICMSLTPFKKVIHLTPPL
jgi:hypothetical protein